MLFFPQPENRPVNKVYLSAGRSRKVRRRILSSSDPDWSVLANWKIMASWSTWISCLSPGPSALFHRCLWLEAFGKSHFLWCFASLRKSQNHFSLTRCLRMSYISVPLTPLKWGKAVYFEIAIFLIVENALRYWRSHAVFIENKLFLENMDSILKSCHQQELLLI